MADSHHENGVYDATGWMRVATALVVALLSAFLVSCSGEQEVAPTPSLGSLGVQLEAIDSHWGNNSIAL